MIDFDLSDDVRHDYIKSLFSRMEKFYAAGPEKVSPTLEPEAVRNWLSDLRSAVPPKQALDHVIAGLQKFSVHTTHPMYYGLFNPRANVTSVAADLITALYNPQLAAWSHAPFAVEVERLLIHEFGKKFGYEQHAIDGAFTTGGAEANLTAILAALAKKYPEHGKEGVRGLKRQPLIYCSRESHHSFIKAAKISGLGSESIKHFDVTLSGSIDHVAMISAIKADLHNGFDPLMIVATLGTTGTGTIESIKDLAQIASFFRLWLHADAAYGGIAILSDRHNHLLEGIDQSDSITFDAHKGMSVSMSASMFITKHKNILPAIFAINTGYMPKDAEHLDIDDPYTRSIQWSRRFIGLKVYLSLLTFGWKGYAEMVEHQFLMARLLRKKLEDAGWHMYNSSNLPVICFGRKTSFSNDKTAAEICRRLVSSGRAWVSSYPVNGTHTIRACITNYKTSKHEIKTFVELLAKITDDVTIST